MNMDGDTNTLHLSVWIDRLQDAVDGSLSATEASRLHEHLAQCELCRREYEQLVAIDQQLRVHLPSDASPSNQFDRQLFARIDRIELEQLSRARVRELQAHAARLANVRAGWRFVLRYQLGNIIAAIATLSSVVLALRSSALTSWGTKAIGGDLANRLSRVQSGLPLEAIHKLGISTTAALLMGGSLAVAAIAMWSASRGDRRTP